MQAAGGLVLQAACELFGNDIVAALLTGDTPVAPENGSA
jgi:hypothetical protein